VIGRKIKTSAEFSDLPLKIQKFSWKSETSRTSRKVPGLRRISSDMSETPPTTPAIPQNSAIFSRTFDRRPAAEKILTKFDISSDSFVLAASISQISLTIL